MSSVELSGTFSNAELIVSRLFFGQGYFSQYIPRSNKSNLYSSRTISGNFSNRSLMSDGKTFCNSYCSDQKNFSISFATMTIYLFILIISIGAKQFRHHRFQSLVLPKPGKATPSISNVQLHHRIRPPRFAGPSTADSVGRTCHRRFQATRADGSQRQTFQLVSTPTRDRFRCCVKELICNLLIM